VDSVFYFEQIVALNKNGAILTKVPQIETLLNLVTVVIIIKINLWYIDICHKSTKRENHKTLYEYNNSLIIKRFIFELINRFFHFFYLGFVQRDVETMRSMLF